MTFEPGDVVALRSGGHFMTVSGVFSNKIECIWIGEQGTLFRETLPPAVLTAANGHDEAAANGHDEDDDAE